MSYESKSPTSRNEREKWGTRPERSEPRSLLRLCSIECGLFGGFCLRWFDMNQGWGGAGEMASGVPAIRASAIVAEAVHGGADVEGSVDQVRDAQGARDFFVLNPVQGAADAASALGAVGVASEDAGFDVGFEVGRIIGRHFCEETGLRILRRIHEGARHSFRKQQLGILLR